MEKLPEKGYFTFAQNTTDVDYLRLAYLQALSIKSTQKINRYAVAVDSETKKEVTEKHKKVFDYIIDIDIDDSEEDDWKFRNEWKVWWLTPFKETVKIESDILLTRNIDHWWAGMQQTDVCITTKICNYENEQFDSISPYRRLFIDNNLPMTYSGFTYFRYSTVSQQFYIYVRYLTEHWDYVKKYFLVNCRDEYPTTDVLYAIAAVLIGEEKCTNPVLSYPTFVHMKGAINKLSPADIWTDKFYCQVDDKLNLTVGFNRQLFPFHYQLKSFATDNLLGKYEKFTK